MYIKSTSCNKGEKKGEEDGSKREGRCGVEVGAAGSGGIGERKEWGKEEGEGEE